MSAVVEGAKRLLGGGSSNLAGRVDGLQRAVVATRGRLPDELVDRAGTIAGRAASRLSLSGDHTVVALAGATGSGKSSTFNALTGMDFAAVGVRRPTTSWTMSCTWGRDDASELLDWIGVPARHRVTRDSMLDEVRDDRDLKGLVLLDLPDHDSTEVAHHEEMDRLLQYADLMIFVLDPQKYADAAIHDRYLRPMASHKHVMLVVLNHIDEVPADRRPAMLADLQRLLDLDGLAGVPVLTTSAKLGDGIPELKHVIAKRVSAKNSTLDRLSADVTTVATDLQQLNGSAKPGDVARQSKAELVDAFADAAGVPMVVKAVRQASLQRSARNTGWPVTRWVGRLRRDPLKQLHLDLGLETKGVSRRTSLPEANAVQRARVDTAVRAVADNVAGNLAEPWASAIHRASTSRLGDLGDALDKAIAETDLGVTRTPLWWRLVRLVQAVLLLGAVAGGVWLLALAAAPVFGSHLADAPTVDSGDNSISVPVVLLVVGVVLGIVIAAVCRSFAGLMARSRARAADRRLRGSIADVTEELVVAPIEDELEAYRRARHGLNDALA
jgi:GTPase Era involved in 16S rRNA processing